MIEKLIRLIIWTFILSFPLFFLPFTREMFEINKLVLLIATDLLLLILITLRTAKCKKITIVGSIPSLALLLLSGVYIISTILRSPNIVIALTHPLSVTAVTSGLILFAFLSTNTSSLYRDKLLATLLFDGVIISLYILLMYLGIINKSVSTPFGNLLSTAIFLFSLSVYYAIRILQIIHKDFSLAHSVKNRKFVFYAVSLAIIIPTLITVSLHLLTDQKPIILPWNYGWTIFITIAQSAETLLLGVGPSNFLTAFTLGRPEALNQTNFWNVTFSSSSSFFLTWATETGIITGLLYLSLMIFAVLRTVQSFKSDNRVFAASLTVTILLLTLLFLPGNLPVFLLILTLLAFCAKNYTWLDINLSKIRLIVYLIPVMMIIFSIVIISFAAKAYLAEIYFTKSLADELRENGGQVYNLQRQGLIMNPYNDNYHVIFSQTSLSLANALAAKQDLSDQDRQNIPRLISQSIEEARSAVRLYPTSIVNWDNLSRTYSQLTNFATGSAQWAIQSADQKIKLDPTSPNPRLSMGLLHLSLKNLPEAEKYLLEAISLKPDLIAAHFNLAKVYKEEQKIGLARDEFQKTKSLLPADSSDHKIIDAELENLPK